MLFLQRRWICSAIYLTRLFLIYYPSAALTSVLSKRWRDLLAFVPYLDIDDSEFLHPEEGKREREGILESFMDFVDRVLALQGDSPIKKLSLKCKTGVDSERVDRWICNVLQRGVSVLSLSIDFVDEYELPREIFVSKKLVVLKVKRGYDLDWSALGISLPMLKNLFLSSVGYWIDQFEMLLPAFPVLEKFGIANFEWTDSNVTVSSASLKELFLHSNGCQHLLNPTNVSFDMPSLVYLWYSDYVAMDYLKVNLTNLVDARLDLKLTKDHIERARAQEDDVFLRFRNVWKLFSGIRNVQKLYLAANTLEVLSLCCESMPVFNNLKLLNITSEEGRGWQAMPVLLRNCPHLETLVLEGLLHFVTRKCGDACDCIYREDKGLSLASCPVKKLQIKGFRGTMREKGMIKYFLDYLQCLKEMEIYAEENEPTDLQVPKVFELLMIFGKFYTCDVQFFVRGSLYKK